MLQYNHKSNDVPPLENILRLVKNLYYPSKWHFLPSKRHCFFLVVFRKKCSYLDSLCTQQKRDIYQTKIKMAKNYLKGQWIVNFSSSSVNILGTCSEDNLIIYDKNWIFTACRNSLFYYENVIGRWCFCFWLIIDCIGLLSMPCFSLKWFIEFPDEYPISLMCKPAEGIYIHIALYSYFIKLR